MNEISERNLARSTKVSPANSLGEIADTSIRKYRQKPWKTFGKFFFSGIHKQNFPKDFLENFVRDSGRYHPRISGRNTRKHSCKNPAKNFFESNSGRNSRNKTQKSRKELWEPIGENPWMESWKKLLDKSRNKNEKSSRIHERTPGKITGRVL